MAIDGPSRQATFEVTPPDAEPSRLAWLLKEKMLPPIYWKGMLRGHEWLARPEKISARAD